jgi:uncharacterized membrane protein HdeD (DUF308 family)
VNPLVSFNRMLGWLYLGIGVITLLAWAVTRSAMVLSVGWILVPLGALHLLAARGFRDERSWRWAAQIAPMLLLLIQLLRLQAR